MTTTTPSATGQTTSPLTGVGVGRGSAVGKVVKLAPPVRPPAHEAAAANIEQATDLVAGLGYATGHDGMNEASRRWYEHLIADGLDGNDEAPAPEGKSQPSAPPAADPAADRKASPAQEPD